MPYYARKHQLTQSLLYHADNRSNAKEFIFNSKPDYNYFINLLKDYSNRFSVKIYHGVIMSNHYHLVLEIDNPENISPLMAGLHRSYSCYHHKLYATSGFLWEGRFKLQPVQKDDSLIVCGRYIERNPVKANIVSESQEYLYSSAAFYCLARDDRLTVEDPLFSLFGKNVVERRIAYREFLKNFDARKESSILQS
jgi:putative transposase